MAETLLETRGLERYFEQRSGLLDGILHDELPQIQAVDGVDLRLSRNETIGVVGESGCGKTTLLMTLIGLYQPSDGQILYKGRDTSEFDKHEWKAFRGDVQIIFQDPFQTLNPKMTVRESLREPLGIHGFDDVEERIHETMRDVELDPPERYLDRVPGQLSGGEKQRVSIARALIVEPEVILADEPVSMLDVSTQASILKLLEGLQESYDVSMLYISHDLSTVGYICDEVNVMYLGRIVERAATADLINDPKHPYSQALINAIPKAQLGDRERTKLEGAPRDPIDIGEGCRFRDRCPERMDVCERTPRFVEAEGRRVACHLYYDHEEATATGGAEATTDGGRS